jgi:hypothetical protein
MGTSLTIERAIGSYAQREQMINYALDHVKESESMFSGVRQTWPRLYDLWRGTWTSAHSPHRNSVHIPLIFSALWADAARKAATSLNTFPIVTFLGYGPDDGGIARKREGLFSAQGKDDLIFQKQVDMMLAASLYGTSVMQIGWKRESKMRVIESIDRTPLTNQVVRSIKKSNIVTFDGPESKQIDLIDFFPAPGFRTIAEMPRVGRRYYLDLDNIRYLAKEGIFDVGEVARMEREGGVNTGVVDSGLTVQRFQARTGMTDEQAQCMSKWNRPVECIDVWGLVPSELCPDGVYERIVTVMNRRYLARNRPIPYWHGLKPFLSHAPMPDLHYFYAAGKAEIVAKLQIVANRYVNQSLDAADLMIDPMWFYDRAAGIKTSNLYSKPGKYIPVTGNPNSVIAPMIRDLSGLTVADNKVGQMTDAIQRGTGIVDDAVAGMGGDSRQTAREFVGRREAAGTRLLLEARLYEETLLEPMANMFMALDRQFLELPVEVLILGEGARIDPDTSAPLRGSRETLDGYDLTANYSARALGSSSGLSKGMKQQNLISLLSALSGPIGQVAMGQINAVNFFRGLFREFEIPNINDIFTANPALGELIPPGTPGGVAGVPTSGQIAQTGALPIPAMAGDGPPPNSAQSMMQPIDIGATQTNLPAGMAA